MKPLYRTLTGWLVILAAITFLVAAAWEAVIERNESVSAEDL